MVDTRSDRAGSPGSHGSAENIGHRPGIPRHQPFIGEIPRALFFFLAKDNGPVVLQIAHLDPEEPRADRCSARLRPIAGVQAPRGLLKSITPTTEIQNISVAMSYPTPGYVLGHAMVGAPPDSEIAPRVIRGTVAKGQDDTGPDRRSFLPLSSLYSFFSFPSFVPRGYGWPRFWSVLLPSILIPFRTRDGCLPLSSCSRSPFVSSFFPLFWAVLVWSAPALPSSLFLLSFLPSSVPGGVVGHGSVFRCDPTYPSFVSPFSFPSTPLAGGGVVVVLFSPVPRPFR